MLQCYAGWHNSMSIWPVDNGHLASRHREPCLESVVERSLQLATPSGHTRPAQHMFVSMYMPAAAGQASRLSGLADISAT